MDVQTTNFDPREFAWHGLTLTESAAAQVRKLTASKEGMLGMRLGEGSGCPIAFEIVDAACAVINTMATFEEAEINDDYLTDIRKADSFTVV